MYELTILCIMRNSTGYLDRFVSQVNAVFDAHQPAHLIITEGDSDDGTKERLAQIAAHDDNTVHADVTVVELDTGKPMMIGSANHPARWWMLETAWNECLRHLEPTKYAVCVESDLIWSPNVLEKMLTHLDAGKGDVVLPMLMGETPSRGHYYYDIHANKAGGISFQNYPPYHPSLKPDEQFLTLDHGGGMLVTYGETLSKAHWANECILQWPMGMHIVMDTQAEILHP